MKIKPKTDATPTKSNESRQGLKAKTGIKAGAMSWNHNQARARLSRAS